MLVSSATEVKSKAKELMLGPASVIRALQPSKHQRGVVVRCSSPEAFKLGQEMIS